MKFLFDTNIWIPLEPTGPSDVAPATPTLAELVRLISNSGNQPYVHPASLRDIGNDRNESRRDTRRQLLGKYPTLPDPPPVTSALTQRLGEPTKKDNDAVDNELLAAVERDAVDYLVTEDNGVHTKAGRVGLSQRVVTAADALAIVRNLFPPPGMTLPPLRRAKAHVLDENDPIFESFRADYPGFDDWLRRCKRQHRDAWVIAPPDAPIQAFAILKREQPAEEGLEGAALKVCSFKVSDDARGFRFGELLLRALFDDAYRLNVDWVYATAFAKQVDLCRLFDMFGFIRLDRLTALGESIYAKALHPIPNDSSLSALDFHRRFGPRHIKLAGTTPYLVPIQPMFHERLFPELEEQGGLFPGQTTFGNSILKAYLCNAPIRRIAPGDVLLFYRSTHQQARAVGVVDGTLRSSSPEEVSRFVGRRTVYDFATISEMCARGEVLAILFRQAESLAEWAGIQELQTSGVLTGPPQTISTISQQRGIDWLTERLAR